MSGAAFVYVVGCQIRIGSLMYCYVQEPASCGLGASPSNRYPGAAYRTC